jgi:tetratricopeptide (TPR) repeat protein
MHRSKPLNLSAKALVPVLLLSGCATSYVPDAKRSKTEAQSSVLDEAVYFEVSPAMTSKGPDCIHVLPFSDPKQLDPNTHFRKAFHAQLSVTGVRLIPLQAIAHSDATRLAQTHSCSYELRGTVTENTRLFLGVYSQFKAGAKVSLIHLPTAQAHWSASHTMVKRDGGLPIGIISSIASAVSAAKNVESDQSVRVSHELAYRMVKSIPNLQYVDQSSVSLAVAAPAEATPVQPRVLSAQERLDLAVERREHASVITIAEEMLATGKRDSRILGHRGQSYQALGQHEKASGDFISAIALGDASEKTYIRLGRSYAALGRFDFAAAAFDKAAALNPKSIDAMMLSGVAHSANGDEDLAYEQLRLALVASLASADQLAGQRVVNALYSTNLFERLSEKDRQFLKSQL